MHDNILSETSHIGDQAEQDFEARLGDPNLPTPTSVTREEDLQDPLPIKLTGYLLLIMIVTIGLGVTKAVDSYRNQGQASLAVVMGPPGCLELMVHRCALLAELKKQRPGIWPGFFDDDWAPPILKIVRHPAVPSCLYSLFIMSYSLLTSPVFLTDLQDALRLSFGPSPTERFIKIMQINDAVVSLVLIISMFGMGLSLEVLAILWAAQQPQMLSWIRPMRCIFCLVILMLLYVLASQFIQLYVRGCQEMNLPPSTEVQTVIILTMGSFAAFMALYAVVFPHRAYPSQYIHLGLPILVISMIVGSFLSYPEARDGGRKTIAGCISVVLNLYYFLTALPATWRGYIPAVLEVPKNVYHRVRHWNGTYQWGYMWDTVHRVRRHVLRR